MSEKLKVFEQKFGKSDKPPKQSNNTPRTPRQRKPKVPEHIKVLFGNLDKSIVSVWGPKPDGKNKWDAKYTMWLSFKKWFEVMM